MNYKRLVTGGLCLSVLWGGLSTLAHSESQPLDPALKKALLPEISPELKPLGIKPEDQQVFADYIDLNGDGVRDAIVIFTGSYWCGSGGCTMKVFAGRGRAFRLVSTSTLIRPPITVSDQKTNGWRDLIVEVSGGGMKPKKVALKFNGKEYPLNPSTQPPLPANTVIQGKVLFADGSEPRSIR
jgi:hypothetical protein